MSYTGNHREYALMLRHRDAGGTETEPRPWLVCIHGTEMGRAELDLTLFRALAPARGFRSQRHPSRSCRCTAHAPEGLPKERYFPART